MWNLEQVKITTQILRKPTVSLLSFFFLEASKISHFQRWRETDQPFTNQPSLKEAKERKLEGLVQRQSEVPPFLHIFLPGSAKNDSVYLQ